MSPEKSLSRYILVVLSISVVLTALVIVAMNAYVNNYRLSNDSDSFIDSTLSSFSYNQGYKDGYNAARDKFHFAPAEIRTISGKIIETTANSLTIDAINLDTDEFVDGVSNVRKVELTGTTKFFRRTALSEAEFDQAMSAWRSTGATKNEPLPSSFTDEEISVSDLQTDQNIVINSNQDIRLMETFTAESIVVVE
jgi:hypothetical protein